MKILLCGQFSRLPKIRSIFVSFRNKNKTLFYITANVCLCAVLSSFASFLYLRALMFIETSGLRKKLKLSAASWREERCTADVE